MTHNTDLLTQNPVVPVVTINQVDDAIPLAEALLAGGISIIEVTLRTEAALAAMEAIAKHVPEMHVGAGTILSTTQLTQCRDHGANFGLSPGATNELLASAKAQGWTLIPGVATPSDIMNALDHGYDTMKFFPAETYGGVSALKSFAGPFSGVKFCPTGGIKPTNMKTYLDLPNVFAVGGTWLTPSSLMNEQRWSDISDLCREALKISQ